MANGRLVDLVTFVGVFDPRENTSFLLAAPHVLQVESSFGEAMQFGEFMTERGQGRIVSVPRNQMDLIIEHERIEVRRRYPGTSVIEASSQMARLFSVALETLTVDPKEVPWLRTGYNFVLSVPTDEIAIVQLARGLFSKDFLDKLEYPIKGAATWLWLEAGQALLWLKLEPNRNDPAASKMTVTANFLEEGGTLVPREAIESKLTGYLAKLNELLDRIAL